MGNARMPVSLHRLSHDAIMVSWSQRACATCELTYCACLSPNRSDAVSARPINVTTRLESRPCVPSLGLADVLSTRERLGADGSLALVCWEHGLLRVRLDSQLRSWKRLLLRPEKHPLATSNQASHP